MPFLCLFLMGIFAVAAVFLSHCKVEMASRHEAWKYRHTPWRAAETEMTGISVGDKELAIVDGKTRVHPSRVIVNEAKMPIPQILDGLVHKAAIKKHYVLGGVWDHREIKFPERSGHPRLVLIDKVNFFGGGSVPLKAFRVVAGF